MVDFPFTWKVAATFGNKTKHAVICKYRPAQATQIKYPPFTRHKRHL